MIAFSGDVAVRLDTAAKEMGERGSVMDQDWHPVTQSTTHRYPVNEDGPLPFSLGT